MILVMWRDADGARRRLRQVTLEAAEAAARGLLFRGATHVRIYWVPSERAAEAADVHHAGN